ncbi:MAG: DUF547 domain-containing protein [Armatimonadetes bacterium]|nr:DUF547 domain-containing protein [Armatimonadota bacterium]
MTLLLCLLGASVAAAEPTAADTLDGLLRDHVRAGRCDLAGVKADPRLAATLALWAKAPEPLAAEAAGDERAQVAAMAAVRLAHYLNAYTTFVLEELCDHWPVAKVTDIDGFHSRATHVLSGRSRTLDELVEQLLRPLGDPRVDTALCPGPRGGAPWRAEAYQPATLDKQLDDQAARALALPGWLRIDRTGRRLALSQVLRWYAVDSEPLGGPAGFVARYAPAEADRAWCRAGGYQVEWLPFDWTVGEAP